MALNALDRLVEFYEHITPEGVEALAALYASDARFKDPFNDVVGRVAIARIFSHMFAQVEAPRFQVTGRLAQGDTAMLVWEFTFGAMRARRLIRGATYLKFNAQGEVALHRDYWDAAEELYEKVPVLGALMRGLRRLLRA